MTKDFIKKHPEFAEQIRTEQPCKLNIYTRLDENNRIVEQWKRDDNDEMVNVTAKARQAQAIELAKEYARKTRLDLYRQTRLAKIEEEKHNAE